jgi:prolyl oligopeptidase
MKRAVYYLFAFLAAFAITSLAAGIAGTHDYPKTKMAPVTDSYHGVEVVDAYRWLEDEENPEVVHWVEEQESLTHSLIDDLPQKEFLVHRYGELWRYDDESVPRRVLNGERIFYWKKNKEDEKWIYMTKANEKAEPKILLNPNEWDATETLQGTVPSRDGKYVTFGKAVGGDENPVIKVMVVETGEILPDKLRGWKQRVTSWLPDNSGFYYVCKPQEGEVPEGEHEYWHAAWFHKLGTPPEEDVKVYWDDAVKERWHGVYVSEDGRYEIYMRSIFNSNEVHFRKTGSQDPLTTISDAFDAEYHVDFVGDKILIHTDKDAPLYQVYITDVDKPGREHWQEFIPEHEKDKLNYIAPINGHIYAVYMHNAYTLIKIYDLEGNYLRDLPFPTIGSGSVSGHWSQPEVWVSFSSFTYPSTTFKYHFDSNELDVYRKFPVEIDVDNMTAEQVWYKSKDGTPVSMFIVHRKDIKLDGNNPTQLSGYGGFNVSMTPRFSTQVVVWLEAGGIYAVANLRGGGEYGREWHEAGMREKKQNVFDDFIAAAEWLIDNKYTNPEKLAIYGGSNGGLLVGAAMVQRPELFKAVFCAVPLLDMINYHTFGLANIWAEEYGSSDDPEQFEYIRAYSPYHNVKDGTRYPASLTTGSENDARVAALHACKMVARLQEADPKGGPHLLLVRRASGHHGGTTLTTQIDQRAETAAFLMNQLGMETPKVAPPE